MKIVCFQPEIPQNIGTILRLCACWNIKLEIIGPMGFFLSNKKLLRAGMDYIDFAAVEIFDSYDQWLKDVKSKCCSRIISTSSNGRMSYTDFQFQENDIIMFGRESVGLSKEILDVSDETIYIPMVPNRRSINLAVSVGIILGEACRQLNVFHNMNAQSNIKK